MPNEQRMRDITREEIRRASGADQYGLNQTTFHTHNNLDSPPIFLPTLTYVGKIPAVPVASGENYFLPQGWSVELFGASGEYRITHNLNTRDYAVVVQSFTSAAITQDTMPWVSIDSVNYFSVYWYDPTSADGRVPFFFQLTRFDNPAGSIPTYIRIQT
jgi:hypothetical protein